MEENSTLHAARSAPTEHRYVILLGKSHGRMRFAYAMIDEDTKSIVPKLNTIIWARLVDKVDFATCVFKNCLYVLGGIEKSTGKPCREVHKYDPYLGRWKQCADMCRPRARLAATAAYGKIFVFGGLVSPTAISDTCESYEPLVDEWHEEDLRLPEARKDHTCLMRENNIYVVGGASPTEVANNNVWVLSRLLPDPRDPEHCIYEWSSLPDPVQQDMGYRLCRHATVLCNDHMYILGGIVHGRSSDGRTVIRLQPRTNCAQPAQPNDNNVIQTSYQPAPNRTETDYPEKGTKMLIATSPAIDAYKFRSVRPDFSIDPDLEEAKQREKDAEDKKRQKDSRRKQRKKKRPRDRKDSSDDNVESQKKEDEEAKKAERSKYEKLEKKLRTTAWKTKLPNMPHPRCSSGTVVIGNKIYVIGGHAVEDQPGRHVSLVEYFHTRKKQWFDAFDLGDDEYTHVDCCVLTVPNHNRDFKPVKYSGCKWVLW
ncbi:hypothetical protein LSH36_488g04045 [Paralvinella palmiformis]|uniref:Uncharacterized protein n=1 Tax=Paralvinella palmiformis TaxID=53620 RepID=A0AAD9J986_9ANNE|nr:hypothetical protein LSH36_488g04045 [Paralvinella palmiformis]